MPTASFASPRTPRALRAASLLGLLVAGLFIANARCAGAQCARNSDCGSRRYCTPEGFCATDCGEDRDCEDGYCDLNGRCQSGNRPDAGPLDDQGNPDTGLAPTDTGLAPTDTGNPPPMDAGFPPVDTGPPPPTDTGNPPPVDNGPPPPTDTGVVPPADRGTPGRGAYLDLCSSGAACMSGDCFLAPGAGEGLCTRPCSATFYGGCGVGMVCAFGPGGSTAGRCVPDDTGARCLVSSNNCARYCYAGGPTNPAHCTRECNTARDCPAGFACQPTTTASGTTRVCVEVEQPCNRAADCATNLCQGYGGCTAQCGSDGDCPQRLTIDAGNGQVVALPPWRCLTVDNLRRCVPPRFELGGDLEGADPLGGVCRLTAGGNRCYSGVCDTDSNTCVQGCTPAGGCPTGTACRTWLPDGPSGQLLLVCRPNGNLPPGAACNSAAQCQSALCLGEGAAGYCTRFCTSDDCPTGMRCTPAGTSLNGIPLSLCQR